MQWVVYGRTFLFYFYFIRMVHKSFFSWILNTNTRIFPFFTGVCLSTLGVRDTSVPGSFPDHWSQVLSGSTPVSGSFPGHWSQVPSRGYQSACWGGTRLLARGVPQDWGVPLARMGPGYPPSGQDVFFLNLNKPESNSLVNTRSAALIPSDTGIVLVFVPKRMCRYSTWTVIPELLICFHLFHLWEVYR